MLKSFFFQKPRLSVYFLQICGSGVMHCGSVSGFRNCVTSKDVCKQLKTCLSSLQ